jgi:hypothetical protein
MLLASTSEDSACCRLEVDAMKLSDDKARRLNRLVWR